MRRCIVLSQHCKETILCASSAIQESRKGKNMESYINNIIDDMREYMKAKPEATPEEAWHHAMDDVTAAGVIESRKKRRDAEKFARKALEDNDLWREAHYVVADTYNKNWLVLDFMLYMIVCLIKHDEIIRRVKESSTTCRQLS